MNGFRWITQPAYQFALVIGLTDGILTALTLSSGKLFTSDENITFGLGARIAMASALSGIFVFYTAEYARLRRQLVHASKQLNLASHGHLATTQLGKTVRRDAITAALLSAACNFLGAAFPLFVGVFFPAKRWLTVVISIIALGSLGAALAHTVCGNLIRWSIALMLSGAASAIIGIELHIV